MPWLLSPSLKWGKNLTMEAFEPSIARLEKSMAASTITLVKPTSSWVR